MSRESSRATIAGILATVVLGALILLGSRDLRHFDAALVAYTFATLFAVFGITYRYTMWLMRPPTAMYFRRGWQAFLHPRLLARNLFLLCRRVTMRFGANDFILRRGRDRWIAHFLIMWGTLIGAAVTFPLVFGWIAFETVQGDFGTYRAMIFGFPTLTFKTGSILGFLVFHMLVWASLLVIPGVMLAFRRRMRDHGEAAVQRFGEDILPLLLLFAISFTGLLLTVSYTFLHGYAYEFLAMLHAVTVIFTLLWLPFGKFFHIFQRPAQLGVSFYQDLGAASPPAQCRRCGDEFASELQVEDLIVVERQLGFDYEMPGTEAGHYQRICPRCRRVMFGIAQGRVWQEKSWIE